MPTYVIEHMEPPTSSSYLPPWVTLEYTRMHDLLVPGGNEVLFTSLPYELSFKGADTRGVLDVMKSRGVPLEKVCLLDPKAEKEISVDDAAEFDWFLYGGILGDDPPKDRTSELRKLGFPTRHLGPVQMTTDTAVHVTHIVVSERAPLDKIPFTDFPTISFSDHESVEMPFRYVVGEDGEPTLPKGMRELLRKDMDMSFDALDEP